MKTKLVSLLTLSLIAILALPATFAAQAAEGPRVNSEAFLPFITMSGCPGTSTNSYGQGLVYQRDNDNPVRPAWNHADKNLALRGYSLTTASKTFVDYGSDDPVGPPQLATIFEPNRSPLFSNVYRANGWNWAPSPDPGSPGGPITDWDVTVLGLQTTPGEPLQVPSSGYDIGGAEVIVLYADQDTIAFKYTRDDSVAPNGYLVHVDNICTDPNLLALYNSLDNTARNTYYGVPDNVTDYNLPTLGSEQVFGTARDTEIRVAVVDSGAFLDPRSRCELWQTVNSCPP